MLKSISTTVLLFVSCIGGLPAQYLMRNDSLGFSVDFPAAFTAVSPISMMQYGGEINLHMFTCVAWETAVFVAGFNRVPSFPENERSIRGFLQEQVTMLELSQDKSTDFKSRETIAAHAGRIKLEYFGKDRSVCVEIIYRSGRLLHLMYYNPGSHSRKRSKRFFQSLKTDW